MILVDANLLLYAYDESAELHTAAKHWLETVLRGTEPVRFPLVTVLAFVRISTNPVVFDRPLDATEAVDIVQRWLHRPAVAIAEPTSRHFDVLASTMAAGQVRGPQTTDAHLAALTVEHGGVLHTTDRGFARYPELAFVDPLRG